MYKRQVLYAFRVLLPLPLSLLLLCRYAAVVAAAACCFLLLFVVVCGMAKFVAGSLNLIPVFYFSPFKPDLVSMVLLDSTVSYLRLRFAYISGNYGHVRSQGGRQPAAAKPPLYLV